MNEQTKIKTVRMGRVVMSHEFMQDIKLIEILLRDITFNVINDNPLDDTVELVCTGDMFDPIHPWQPIPEYSLTVSRSKSPTDYSFDMTVDAWRANERVEDEPI